MAIDSSAQIAPTAKVHANAHIGAHGVVGDFCVIEQDTRIGPYCVIEPYVYVKRWTTMGERNVISAGTVLGSDPLDKTFTGERSYLTIGNGNQIREHYTISRGTKPESITQIGDENYIMTSGHIAHNCVIGNRVVIASCSLIAGYVEIEDQAFVSGGIGVHQFSRIGRLAMVAGMSRVNVDLPPYILYTGYRIAPKGLNLVGLKRAGFTREEVRNLKTAYRLLYRSELNLAEALERIETDVPGEHARHLVEFVRKSKRGICRGLVKTET